MAAGASFIVAPGFDPEVCKHVIDKGGIMMPGTASAGEMQQAMNMGCEALKFFPAEANGGVGMLKNIGAALKGARWMCTGGVNAKNVNDYLGYRPDLRCRRHLDVQERCHQGWRLGKDHCSEQGSC